MLKRKHIFKTIKQVLIHIIFWVSVLFFFTYFFGVGNKNYFNAFNFALFLMPVTIATTYVFIYKLIPCYLITKRYFRFGLYTVYTLIISAYAIFTSIALSVLYLSHFEYSAIGPINKNIIFVMTGVYLVTLIVSAFKLLQLNLKNITKANTLEKKILEAQLKLKEQELNYLKMQIHPHFLFNTLNTMYGFAIKKAEETPEMILKLSNLLDYLLYQVDKPFVSLTEEINHLKDYIALEQLRFNDTLDVSFISNTIPETLQIAPMLLIPFVENSFKHGTIKNGILKIDITINFENDSLYFYIKNTVQNTNNEQQGIGLENIKKRLELLYKNNYNLDINRNNDSFEVKLTLNTKSQLQ
ncbi:sensor histidine kinase [Pontimicrobium sp. MEBiC06410]